MKKKVLSILLCVSLVSSMLIGCGSSSDKTETTDTTTEVTTDTTAATTDEATAVTPAADEPITISLGSWPDDSLADDVTLWEGYTATFNETHPNVTVVPASYIYAVDTFAPLCESGNCPTMYDTWFTEPKKIIAEGYARDITDILQERGWLDAMNPAVRALLSDDNGRVYGVPRDGYALGLMMNADLFKEAGLVDADGYPLYPTTWKDLAEKAVTIKEKTGAAGLCLLAADNAGGWHFSNIAWTFGAKFTTANADGTYTADVDSKEAIAAMEYVKSLKWDYDVLTADPLSETWGTGFTALATGDAAMYIAANDAVNQPTQVNGLPLESLAMCGIPSGDAGTVSLAGGTPYMFAADATDAQVNACLDYLEVMGKAPTATATVEAGLVADAKNRIANGVPVISGFQCWVNADRLALVDKVDKEYGNVDSKMYEAYTKATTEGELRAEESGSAQDLYAELTKVLQEVLTNKDADVASLMKTADENYQTILDGLYPAK